MLKEYSHLQFLLLIMNSQLFQFLDTIVEEVVKHLDITDAGIISGLKTHLRSEIMENNLSQTPIAISYFP